MQQNKKQNVIADLGEYTYKSKYVNLEKIQDFKESIELVHYAANVIAGNQQTLDRLYRWLSREERRLERDIENEKRSVQ